MAIRYGRIVISDEIAATLDKIANAKTSDLGELLRIAGITPAEFEEFVPSQLCQSDKRECEEYLQRYRKGVEALVDAAIADNRPYLDSEQQIKVFMNCPFLSKEELVYRR